MNPIEGVLSGLSARRRMQREDEDAKDREQRRADEAEDRTNQRADRAHTMSERNRALKLRTDLGAAATPTAVVDAEQAGPVDPQSQVAAAAQPLAQVPTVQGRAYGTPEAATAAADTYNAPPAMAARQAQVLASAGDPAGAQQIRAGAMQEQSARLKLNADERAELDARFNADLQSNVNSWETFDAFTSDSAGDGMGGKLKLKTTISPDGKSRIVNVVGPDGALTPTGQSFPNTADGLMLATNELAKMSPDKKLAHLFQKEQLRRQAAAQESTEKYQAGMLKATQDKTAAGIEIAQIRADAAAQARAAKAAQGQGGMTLADLRDGHKGIASTLNADWKAQIEATTDPAQLKAIKVARENEIATVQRLYTGAMSAGFGLTPEQAIVAFRSGEVRSGTVDAPGGGKMKVQGVVYGGKFIPLADNPGTLPPQDETPVAAPGAPGSAAPGAKPAAAPLPPMAAIPTDPSGPKAPPVAPAQPGMVAAAAAAVGKTVKKAARYADGREWKNLAAGR